MKAQQPLHGYVRFVKTVNYLFIVCQILPMPEKLRHVVRWPC